MSNALPNAAKLANTSNQSQLIEMALTEKAYQISRDCHNHGLSCSTTASRRLKLM
jgi:hypothetical protein